MSISLILPRFGSSPLARGLLAAPRRAFCWDQDHPRSRGVYSFTAPIVILTSGSSPLARGLLLAVYWFVVNCGIIPARAGFTWTRRQHAGTRWGSSPLARGLQNHHVPVVRIPGIIPARAGFTKPPRPCSSNPRDHPRSRGVYCRLKPTRKSLRGSSPLARGLRPPDRRLHRPRRIIPARAGFTTRPQSGTPQRTDHPRSRGVY